MSTSTPFVTGMLANQAASPCVPDAFLIVRDTFAGGADDAYWNDSAQDVSSYSPNSAQIPFPTAASQSLTLPSGNTYVMNYFYKAAEPSDTTPSQLSRIGDVFTERYMRWSEFYTAGFIWPAGQKICRIGNTTGLGPIVQLTMVTLNGYTDQYFENHGSQGATALFGDSDVNIGPILATGVWHTWEYYFRKASAANVADGRSLIRIDGSAVLDRNNVITHINDTYEYNFIWIGGNATYNGTGQGGYTSFPQDQHRYIDNVELFSALPCDVTLP